jgi:5'-nucleotidase
MAALAGGDCTLMSLENARPLIVVTNDDGVDSPALIPLRDALAPLGEVKIVVPDRNRSGAARSITMRSPLWVEEVELADGSMAYATDGTPVDCVRMAALGLLDREPDLIVSGVNLGENLGDDITYSGTVAAALEGIMLDTPAVALSAHGYHPGYDLAVPARFARVLVELIISKGFPTKTLLNVNVPDRPWADLAGTTFTRLGRRLYGDKVEYRETHGRRRRFHIYNDDLSYHSEPGTDFDAVAEGFISITPLHFDLMSHGALELLRCWQSDLDLTSNEGDG